MDIVFGKHVVEYILEHLIKRASRLHSTTSLLNEEPELAVCSALATQLPAPTGSSVGDAPNLFRGLFDDLAAGMYASGGVIGRDSEGDAESKEGSVGRGREPPMKAPFDEGGRTGGGCGRIGRRSLLALSAREGLPLFLGPSWESVCCWCTGFALVGRGSIAIWGDKDAGGGATCSMP